MDGPVHSYTVKTELHLPDRPTTGMFHTTAVFRFISVSLVFGRASCIVWSKAEDGTIRLETHALLYLN